MSDGSRIVFLDVFRFVLVSAALISHVILKFQIHAGMPEGTAQVVQALTRSATPGLLILFGIMLDLVYARRFAVSRRQVATAVLARSITCYLCFVALITLGLATGHLSLLGYVGAGMLLNSVPLANIFAVYAVLLPLGLAVLQLDRWRGAGALIGLACAIWAIDAVAMSGHRPLAYPFAHLGGFLYGIGEARGPGLPHALFLALVGICIGRAVFRPTPSRSAQVLMACLVIGSLAMLAWQAATHAGLAYVRGAIADYSLWRAHNHPAYYAFGICTTVTLLGLVRALCRAFPHLGVVQSIGRRTLTYFLIGNALIMAAPQWQAPAGVLVLGFPVAAAILTLGWAHGPAHGSVMRRIDATLTHLAATLVAVIPIAVATERRRTQS